MYIPISGRSYGSLLSGGRGFQSGWRFDIVYITTSAIIYANSAAKPPPLKIRGGGFAKRAQWPHILSPHIEVPPSGLMMMWSMRQIPHCLSRYSNFSVN